MNNEHIDFLIRNNVNLFVSIDGDKEINDENRVFFESRKSVFDSVIDNLKYLYLNHREYYKMHIRLMMVVDPKRSIAEHISIKEKYKFLDELDIRILLKNDDFLEEKNIYSSDFNYENQYMNFLALSSIEKKFDLTKKLKYFQNVYLHQLNNIKYIKTSNINDNVLPGGQCIPGIAKIFVLTNGNIMSCEKLSELNPKNVVGNIYDGFDIEKCLKVINCTKQLLNKCNNCFAYSDCLMCSVGIESEQTDKYCELYKQAFHEKIKLKIIFKEIEENKYIEKVKKYE